VENINLSLATQEAKIKRLRWQLKRIKPTVDIFSGVGGPNSLAALKQKLAVLLTKYTENYPEVIRVKAQIEELEKKAEKNGSAGKSSGMTTVNPLYQQVQQQLYDAEVEASSLKAKKASLEARIAEREAALREVPEARKKLGALIQQRDSIRDIYQKLLGRLAQSEVSKQIEISDKAATFKIIDPALYPEKPVSPNMPVMLSLALVSGLAVGFGLIYLLDLLDDSLKDPHQLEAMGVNPLVVIPRIEEGGIVDTRIRKWDVLFFAGVGFFYCFYLALLAAEALQLDPMSQILARLSLLR
jgi:polysaccharide chain length determinant protein (PEP-CTERM system associated)